MKPDSNDSENFPILMADWVLQTRLYFSYLLLISNTLSMVVVSIYSKKSRAHHSPSYVCIGEHIVLLCMYLLLLSLL